MLKARVIKEVKIAHIAVDEKFIDSAREIFEITYPLQNTFYIASQKPWRFLNDNANYIELNLKKWLQLFLFNQSEIKSYDVVIFHGLKTSWIIPILMCKQRYIWIGWGADYYNRSFGKKLLNMPLVLDKTRSYTKEISSNNINFKSRFLKLIKGSVKRIIGNKFFFDLACKRIEIFSPVLPKEYDLVKEKFGLGKNTNYVNWNYGFLEGGFITNIDIKDTCSSRSILLGNSATDTNNHIEALDLLSDIGSGKQIYIPLSYGDIEYANVIKNYISSNPYLAKHCKILDSFLPIDEYNNIVSECGFVIMNHVRQQALGNIIAMMYRGCKLFLREESILYDYFKDQGAIIYSIQELEQFPDLINSHLTVEQIKINRNILERNWSKFNVVNKTKNLINKAIYNPG